MMTEKDKIKCANIMYEFWRKRVNVIYLANANTGYAPEDVRLFYCELLSYYLDGKEKEQNE